MGKVKGIVRSCTDPKEWNGIMQIGFTLQDNPSKWYNIDGDKDALFDLKKTMISKGNEIEFEFEKGKVRNINLIAKAKTETSGNWADEMTNFEDLLTAAHERGIISIHTELIQIDPAKKFAVFKATAKGFMPDEQESRVGEFTGYGDSEGITSDNIKPHWIRMAETRAIVRALRWYTNNASVAVEETSEEEKSDNPPKKK